MKEKNIFDNLSGRVFDAIRLLESAAPHKDEVLSRFALRNAAHSLQSVLDELNDLGCGIHDMQKKDDLCG